jgi:lysophospholipase
LIVVVNGRTESWLKYGEFFHDLYGKGYSIISYDHRGQGLSQRLGRGNPQIGNLDDFSQYARDLDALMTKHATPGGSVNGKRKIYLIAHSMGGAVASLYLEQYAPRSPSPFKAVVLSAPMYGINTDPYPSPLTHGIVRLFQALGLGRHYAPGEHDRNGNEAFASNSVTGSRVRWQVMNRTWEDHPEAVVAGASNDWVSKALDAAPSIRKQAGKIGNRTMILEAGKDRLVLNSSIEKAARLIGNCRLVIFPESKHEIFMESDPIRGKALSDILGFFQEK